MKKMSLTEEEFLPSMVVHQMLSREASAEPEDFTSSMASHRLSRNYQQEDLDHGEDPDIVSEVANITNMIEKLSRDVVEDVEQHDIGDKGDTNVSQEDSNVAINVHKNDGEAMEELSPHEPPLSSMDKDASKDVDDLVNIGNTILCKEQVVDLNVTMNENKTDEEAEKDVPLHEPLMIANLVSSKQASTNFSNTMSSDFDPEDSPTVKVCLLNENETSLHTPDDDDDDFDDSNAVVYSCTLGDNLPVIIQAVGNELIENDEEEEDFLGEPVESKLVISFDGKISEINSERNSIIEVRNSYRESFDTELIINNENCPVTDDESKHSEEKSEIIYSEIKQEETNTLNQEENNNESRMVGDDLKHQINEDKQSQEDQHLHLKEETKSESENENEDDQNLQATDPALQNKDCPNIPIADDGNKDIEKTKDSEIINSEINPAKTGHLKEDVHQEEVNREIKSIEDCQNHQSNTNEKSDVPQEKTNNKSEIIEDDQKHKSNEEHKNLQPNDRTLQNENWSNTPTTDDGKKDIEKMEESDIINSEIKQSVTRNLMEEVHQEETNTETKSVEDSQKHQSNKDEQTEKDPNLQRNEHGESDKLGSCKCKDKDKNTVSANIHKDDENKEAKNKEAKNPSKDAEDIRLIVSQEPKKKRKIVDILFGCFKCTKKQDD